MKKAILQSLLPVFLMTSVFGCSNSEKTATNITPAPVTTPDAVVVNPAKYGEKDVSRLFVLKQEANVGILVDGKNQNVAVIKAEKSGKFKIENAGGKDAGYIVAKKDSWKIKNSDQSQELYVLKKQEDGDFKLKDAANKEIYRIKARGQGFEIETPDKKSIYKLKIKDNKISLVDAANKTVFWTTSKLSPIAVTCFGFDVINIEQRAGLAYAVNLTGGK